MLRPRRRYSPTHEPRIEMTPLLDVIFLLLTFFIFAVVLMVRAEVIPVKLPVLSTGERADAVNVAGITVDRDGRFFLNQEPVNKSELERRLAELAAEQPRPVFYLAVDAGKGPIDRAPLLLDMIELFRRLKIESLNIVGSGDATERADP